MSTPPSKIDGAEVLEWAWSGSQPFGVIRAQTGEVSSEIYGLAICRYKGSSIIYRFSCDANWEVEQDADYPSIQEAKESLPAQYRNTHILWQQVKTSSGAH